MIRPTNVAMFVLSCIAIIAGSPQHVHAQCSYTTSILDSYLGQGDPRAGQTQTPSAAWTYERTGPNGTARILLTGVTSTSWNVPDNGGAWGSPDQPYYVPLAGPLYSPIAARNQNPYHQRTPSFEGIMLHPNFGIEHAKAVLTAPAPLTVSGLHVHVELLGSASGNAVISASVELAAGGTVILIPDVTILSLAPAMDLTPASGLPFTLATGDRLVITTADGGSAAEDWMNVDATVEVSGQPLLLSAPIARANCGGDPTVRIVTSGATSLRWSKDGVPLSDGPTGHGSTLSGTTASTLTIAAFGSADIGQYRCLVGNACGMVQSVASVVSICFADFNCDGTVNSADFFDYLVAFFANQPAADRNHDGTVNSQDFFDFIAAFFAGCA